ncbi:hypothetical protein [Devosia chinhatensis]|uniref:Uracil-DNA glycosylase-like domain-containing protein n=1 Tax=Devosia chinhatensis TaxID=429727 RepID=A0A0F5FNH1_9HYPH|nr:hypothetical protein [Devosia chinhatensis]KKB10090.1 hypothetical protein VE26_09975 [Devosia chinhatensis]
MVPSLNPPWTRLWPEPDRALYRKWVARRRALDLPGYASFADVGLDGEWTTPYHLAACAHDGPVLVTYNYLDAPSAKRDRDVLSRLGYLPDMAFNRVLDLALAQAETMRAELYVTHAFHMLPATRSAAIASKDVDTSFDIIGRHECEGRRVIALGEVAARTCRRHNIAHRAVPHPSARGTSFANRAGLLAEALRELTCRSA